MRLTAEARQILRHRIAHAPGSWVFPGRTHIGGSRYQEVADRPITYSALVGAHERALKQVQDVPDFSLYSLRHTFATWFYDKTKDLVALKQVLGHSDLRTVLRYVNDPQTRMDKAMEGLRGGGLVRGVHPDRCDHGTRSEATTRINLRGTDGHSMNWNLAVTGRTRRGASSLHSIGGMVVEIGRQALVRTHGIVASGPFAVRQSLKSRGRRRTESLAPRLGAGWKRPRMSVQLRDPCAKEPPPLAALALPKACRAGPRSGDSKTLAGSHAKELSAHELAALQRDWTREFEHWHVRHLAERQYDHFWMAGVTVPTCIEPGGPSIFVAFCVDRHGPPELLGLGTGRPESDKDWGRLLADLKRRGVSNGPKIAVGDVAQGALLALRAECGQTGTQIGWRRESVNRPGLIPSDRRSNARSQVNAPFAAARNADTEGAINCIVGRCAAVGCRKSEHSRPARDQQLPSHGSSRFAVRTIADLRGDRRSLRDGAHADSHGEDEAGPGIRVGNGLLIGLVGPARTTGTTTMAHESLDLAGNGFKFLVLLFHGTSDLVAWESSLSDWTGLVGSSWQTSVWSQLATQAVGDRVMSTDFRVRQA